MKEKVETILAPEAIGPYSQAIATEGLVFVSGQLPIDRSTSAMPAGIEAQTKQSLENIKHILKEAGLDMDKIVKTTVLLQDIKDFGKMNEVYATFFNGVCPARACYQVVALPKGALIEIEAIATK